MLHADDSEQLPARTWLVVSKISIAHGVPLTLTLDCASSNTVEPAARIPWSALSVTVGLSGTRRTGAPPARPAIGATILSEQAPGAPMSGLAPSVGQADKPLGTAAVPRWAAATIRLHAAPAPELGHWDAPFGTMIFSVSLSPASTGSAESHAAPAALHAMPFTSEPAIAAADGWLIEAVDM